MEKSEIDEIIACLPSDRTAFRYFKDAYAIALLAQAAEDGIAISELRRSRYGSLLAKPDARALLASCGDGRIDRARLLSRWKEPSLPFLLSLGAWGGKDRAWQQTSRRGWNLVLRLNFVAAHDARFRAVFSDRHRPAGLNYAGHPVLRRGERDWYRETLAWSRLDVDFENGQVLVEEIQSDWIGEAERWRGWLDAPYYRRTLSDQERRRRREYLDQVLATYASIWDEAMLTATLGFLLDELGICDVWYHSWRCGVALKGISPSCGPPKSLYTELPRRFCFERTAQMPKMLDTAKRRSALRRAGIAPMFFRLQLGRSSCAHSPQAR